MAVGTVSSVLTTSKTPSNDVTKFAKDFDSFLLLLTEQLKNQDPTSPMDATQFTTQLVQFTSVEQQIKQNQNLQALLDAQQSVSLASAANYIGKTVEAGGKNVILNGGQGTMSYRLDLPAKDVSIAIKNSSGEVVRTLTGPTQTGLQTVTWDGKAESGVRLPDGTYSYVINARDSNNQAINVRTGYSGVIDAFEVIDGAIVLRSGAARVPIADVKAVRS